MQSDSTPDSEGNWSAATTTTETYEGRFETNSSNRYINAQDGQQIVYTGIVYMNKGDDIVLGSAVQVLDNMDNQLAKGTVKAFSKGQLNQRIWL